MQGEKEDKASGPGSGMLQHCTADEKTRGTGRPDFFLQVFIHPPFQWIAAA
jgi:hypothetical protein